MKHFKIAYYDFFFVQKKKLFLHYGNRCKERGFVKRDFKK